jgi:molecular chaperone DnaJ
MFKIKGKGMPVLGGRGRGDLYVGINVVTPTNLSRDQRKLLEELAAIEADGRQDKGIVEKVKDIFG